MINGMFPAGAVKRVWAHVETPFKKGSRPIDQSRYLFDSDDPAAVEADCERAVAQGVQAFMYNSYAKGSYEDKSRSVYFSATQKAGMDQLINIDGANIMSQSAYLAYLNYTAGCIDSLPNYETCNGKPIVTIFGKSGEQAAWFEAGESAHPDICFVYYGTPYGKNLMDWIKSGLTTNQEVFCKKYANLKDGNLYIPCVFHGFDDTVMRNGKPTSVWNPNEPARVWPTEGPNAATWAQSWAVINKYYSSENPAPAVQVVTWNDLDEATGRSGYGIPQW